MGSLCVKDKVPRQFCESDIAILSNFANIVTTEFELRQVASTDSLTGAKSRGAWMEEASQALEVAQEENRPATIVIMDIDNFKNVNDTFGHCVGDEVIKELVHIVNANIRDFDIFGRFGGEEFVLLLNNATSEKARIVIERICETFAKMELVSLKGKRCTVSLGFTQNKYGDSITTALNRADQALYEAKRGGRNRAVCLN